MSRCSRGGSEHKFEPRYDEEPNKKLNSAYMVDHLFTSDEGFRMVFVIKKYVKDICVRCGKSIWRV